MNNSRSGVIIFILILIIGYLVFDKIETKTVFEKQEDQIFTERKVFTPTIVTEESPAQKAQKLECEKLGEDFFTDMVARSSNYYDAPHKTAIFNNTCYVAIGNAGGMEIKVNEFTIFPNEVIYNVKTGEILRLTGTTLVRNEEGNLKPVCLATLTGIKQGLYKCLDLEVRGIADIEKGIFN